MLRIDGVKPGQMVDFMGHLASPVENAVYLSTTYLGLPGYAEMGDSYDKCNMTPELDRIAAAIKRTEAQQYEDM